MTREEFIKYLMEGFDDSNIEERQQIEKGIFGRRRMYRDRGPEKIRRR